MAHVNCKVEEGMTKKLIVTVILVVAWACFATLFYKTIMVMLGLWLWQKELKACVAEADWMPRQLKAWAVKAVWACMIVCLWAAMPRWRIDSGDRVRLVYLDKAGNAKHPPLLQYLVNTLVPEEEMVNFGIGNAAIAKYDLDAENPMSGVYAQAFHDFLGDDARAVYICNPKGDDHVKWGKDNGFKYPLVVFCHSYMGNLKLYKGVWKDLNNCIVLSIGTPNHSDIFTQDDIKEIFDFYIPALERMGYSIDKEQLHLIGLSYGGSAIASAMHSPYADKFESLTIVSCNLGGLKRVKCQVNFIGGGKDRSSNGMPDLCRRLKAMGVDASIYFDEYENHFILVNKREEIISFLKDRMQLKCVRMSE